MCEERDQSLTHTLKIKTVCRGDFKCFGKVDVAPPFSVPVYIIVSEDNSLIGAKLKT